MDIEEKRRQRVHQIDAIRSLATAGIAPEAMGLLRGAALGNLIDFPTTTATTKTTTNTAMSASPLRVAASMIPAGILAEMMSGNMIGIAPPASSRQAEEEEKRRKGERTTTTTKKVMESEKNSSLLDAHEEEEKHHPLDDMGDLMSEQSSRSRAELPAERLGGRVTRPRSAPLTRAEDTPVVKRNQQQGERKEYQQQQQQQQQQQEQRHSSPPKFHQQQPKAGSALGKIVAPVPTRKAAAAGAAASPQRNNVNSEKKPQQQQVSSSRPSTAPSHIPVYVAPPPQKDELEEMAEEEGEEGEEEDDYFYEDEEEEYTTTGAGADYSNNNNSNNFYYYEQQQQKTRPKKKSSNNKDKEKTYVQFGAATASAAIARYQHRQERWENWVRHHSPPARRNVHKQQEGLIRSVLASTFSLSPPRQRGVVVGGVHSAERERTRRRRKAEPTWIGDVPSDEFGLTPISKSHRDRNLNMKRLRNGDHNYLVEDFRKLRQTYYFEEFEDGENNEFDRGCMSDGALATSSRTREHYFAEAEEQHQQQHQQHQNQQLLASGRMSAVFEDDDSNKNTPTSQQQQQLQNQSAKREEIDTDKVQRKLDFPSTVKKNPATGGLVVEASSQTPLLSRQTSPARSPTRFHEQRTTSAAPSPPPPPPVVCATTESTLFASAIAPHLEALAIDKHEQQYQQQLLLQQQQQQQYNEEGEDFSEGDGKEPVVVRVPWNFALTAEANRKLASRWRYERKRRGAMKKDKVHLPLGLMQDEFDDDYENNNDNNYLSSDEKRENLSRRGPWVPGGSLKRPDSASIPPAPPLVAPRPPSLPAEVTLVRPGSSPSKRMKGDTFPFLDSAANENGVVPRSQTASGIGRRTRKGEEESGMKSVSGFARLPLWQLFGNENGTGTAPLPPSALSMSSRSSSRGMDFLGGRKSTGNLQGVNSLPTTTTRPTSYYRHTRPTTAPAQTKRTGFDQAAIARHAQMFQQMQNGGSNMNSNNNGNGGGPYPPSAARRTIGGVSTTPRRPASSRPNLGGGVGGRRRLSETSNNGDDDGDVVYYYLPVDNATMLTPALATAAAIQAHTEATRPYLQGYYPPPQQQQQQQWQPRPPSAPSSSGANGNNSSSSVFLARAEALLSSAMQATGQQQQRGSYHEEQDEVTGSVDNNNKQQQQQGNGASVYSTTTVTTTSQQQPIPPRFGAKDAVQRLFRVRRERQQQSNPEELRQQKKEAMNQLAKTAAQILPQTVGRLDTMALMALSEHLDSLQRQTVAMEQMEEGRGILI